MVLAKVLSSTRMGVDARPVEAEVDLAYGLPVPHPGTGPDPGESLSLCLAR